MTEEDRSILLFCIHNALWMTNHKDQLRAIDAHIATLDPVRKSRAIEMLREIMEAS